MNNEEVLYYDNFNYFSVDNGNSTITYSPPNFTPSVEMTINPSYEYYSNNIYNFNLRDKIMDEIKCNIEKLGEAYDVVSSKEDKYFIKGQIAALSEMKYRIEKEYWTYMRGGE